jgi:hypothetical protein
VCLHDDKLCASQLAFPDGHPQYDAPKFTSVHADWLARVEETKGWSRLEVEEYLAKAPIWLMAGFHRHEVTDICNRRFYFVIYNKFLRSILHNIQALLQFAHKRGIAQQDVMVPIRVLCLPPTAAIARCLGTLDNAEQENRALTCYVSQLISLFDSFNGLSLSASTLMSVGLESGFLDNDEKSRNIVKNFEIARRSDLDQV